MNEITILIVDDHEVVRLGIRTLLRRQKNFTVVGAAASGHQALSMVESLRPQIVLMDVRMPDMSGIETCREIMSTWPETRVIMLTSHVDDEAAMASLLAGASGYLLKDVQGPELIRAVETVANDGSLVDPKLAQQVFRRIRARSTMVEQEATLTQHQKKILELISQGKTNREIASLLFLSEKTVRNYVSKILDKLGLANRAEAAAYAARQRLLNGKE